jgi:hypothetical protein
MTSFIDLDLKLQSAHPAMPDDTFDTLVSDWLVAAQRTIARPAMTAAEVEAKLRIAAALVRELGIGDRQIAALAQIAADMERLNGAAPVRQH